MARNPAFSSGSGPLRAAGPGVMIGTLRSTAAPGATVAMRASADAVTPSDTPRIADAALAPPAAGSPPRAAPGGTPGRAAVLSVVFPGAASPGRVCPAAALPAFAPSEALAPGFAAAETGSAVFAPPATPA